jgi:arabinofuranosyltransferase
MLEGFMTDVREAGEDVPVDDAALPGRPRFWNAAMFAAVLVLFAVLAWRQRWMSDDGLIVLRTVRQILAGNGPVFNIGERVEVNTSPLWTDILTVLALVPGLPLEWISLLTGLFLAVAGLFLGMDGARRLYRPSGYSVVVAPAGALVVCALPPFHDFATSGLETGLSWCWLGGTWWLLVRRQMERPDGVAWPMVVVIGLGPLVRPDLALFSAAAFAALVVLSRPGWAGTVRWLAVAGALPVAYQIFRMGYYGLPVPNTALAKEAGVAQWWRGWVYFLDLITPYALLLPILLLAVAVAMLVRSGSRSRVFAVLTIMPVLTAVALALYVIRVGGDFMHGRMLLPSLFCLLLPVMAVPVTRRTAVALAGVTAWAVVAGVALRVPYIDAPSALGITDERGYWVWATGVSHPITAEDYAKYPGMPAQLAELRGTEEPSVIAEGLSSWQSYPTTRSHSTIATDSMGALGLLTPLDLRIHDDYSLATPLGSHSLVVAARIGHEKRFPALWDIADAGQGDWDRDGHASVAAPEQIESARAALRCPEIAEILDSVREPLTFGRFWANLTGAVQRSGVRFSRDPAIAERCD